MANKLIKRQTGESRANDLIHRLAERKIRIVFVEVFDINKLLLLNPCCEEGAIAGSQYCLYLLTKLATHSLQNPRFSWRGSLLDSSVIKFDR